MAGESEELVAILDAAGVAVGAAPRSVVRRDNLRHAATAVLVRDPAGRIYVHRRTPSKDLFPGMNDCWAGGVLGVGERPEDGARRELSEELGIEGVVLEALFTMPYEDELTTYVVHGYTVTYDGTCHGPIVHQESEVAWGAWFTVAELRAHLADPTWAFVPDGRAMIERWLAS